jgi:alkylation response protein AidB-like acyl-CoA dehydrogenase
MIEWSEQHLMIQDMVRKFVEAEIKPRLEELEHGDLPPYDILRKMLQTFGIDEVARQRFASQIARDKAKAEGHPVKEKGEGGGGTDIGMTMIPNVELCRYCPGMVTAMGVSVGLTSAAIMSKGTIAQKERWALPLMTMEKIGAWAITEPDSGSDAFGGMKATARRDGNGGYVLNGNKTFITNGPYADTIVFICKLDDGDSANKRDRKILSFILDKGMPGLTQSKPLRKMGMHSSPTGELFLADVHVGKERLIGETEDIPARSGAKDTFSMERSGVASMALGIVEECRSCASIRAHARRLRQANRRVPAHPAKLAQMEVARMNIQNIVFRQIEMAQQGKSMTLAEASATKLYSAQTCMAVCLEAVQLFGGNGYMAEYRVEQLCRDAKVLQIYGGTDEIQVSAIARGLLAKA